MSRFDVCSVLRLILLDFLIDSLNDLLIDSQNGTVDTNRRFKGSKVIILTHKGIQIQNTQNLYSPT